MTQKKGKAKKTANRAKRPQRKQSISGDASPADLSLDDLDKIIQDDAISDVNGVSALAAADINEDGTINPKKCPHLKAATRITRVGKQLPIALSKAKGPACIGCKRDFQKAEQAFKTKKPVTSEEADGKSDPPTPVAPTPPKPASSLWLCLFCAEINCGRYDEAHGTAHYDKEQHDVVINIETLECWCYACDMPVVGTKDANQTTFDAKNMVEKVFGVKKKPAITPEIKKVAKPPVRRREAPVPGLANLGNTCFFNSVMQCITYTNALRPWLQTTPSETSSSSVTDSETPNEIIPPRPTGALSYAFTSLLNNIHSSKGGTSLNPSELFHRISNKWTMYKRMGQQDSHELMRRLLDGLKEEVLKKDEKGKHLPKQVTYVDDVFGGNLVSVIVCHSCKNISYSYEDFMDVSLPIVGAKEPKSFFDLLPRRTSKVSPSASPEPPASVLDSLTDAMNGTSITDGSPTPVDEKDKLIQQLLKPIQVAGETDALVAKGTLSGKGPVTVEKCLAEFLAVEVLDGSNGWACEECYKRKYGDDKEEAANDGEQKENGEEATTAAAPTDNTAPHVDGQEVIMGDVSPLPATAIVDVTMEEATKESKAPTPESSTAMEMDDITVSTNDSADSEISDANGILTPDTPVAAEVDDAEEADEAVPKTDRFGNTLEVNTNLLPPLPLSAPTSATPSRSTTPVPSTSSKRKHPLIYSRSSKRYLLHSLPNVLVLHLKRFQQVGFSGRTRKVEDVVKFEEFIDVDGLIAPPEKLVKEVQGVRMNGEEGKEEGMASEGIAPPSTIASKPETTKYRLYGVVVHMGGLFGGHYVAYIRVPPKADTTGEDKKNAFEDEEEEESGGGWAYCSDTHVKSCGWEEVEKAQAYILFYEKWEG
ncbi:Ubiquitin carboxyl-terminal hydrolase 45 [Rhizophlyctis rosea]|uniref:Ubiquitin carboxyl-terminal hydrolase n=1 Tax=Rhizophlyctis rosea TaxID=64517 RepID=A0AAD5SQM0_9FUNG|nr:Ubiquitin carboxyl-terminal hydrolase 45 [Rhizophlyctis rosea]